MNFLEGSTVRRAGRCAGLYLWYGHDSELYASLVIAVKKNGRVRIESTYYSGSFEEIVRNIPGNIPLLISIDGSNVIHRLVDRTSSENPVSQAFPGSGIKDFFFRKHDAGKDKTIVSLIRKDDIHKLVQSLNESGLLVCDLKMGPFNIESLTGITAGNDEIAVPFYTLSFKEGKVINFVRCLQNSVENNYSVDFDSDSLSSEYLVPLSLCYTFFQSGFEDINDEVLSVQRKELAAKRILSVTVLPFLLLIFVSLAVNFILLLNFDKQSRLISDSVTDGKQQLVEIDSLRKTLVIKQKVIEARNNRSTKLLTYFSDRIASCVPSGIVLAEMSVFPPKSGNQKKEQFLFSDGIIYINGLAGNTVSLEEFVEKLSSFRWIESVRINSYSMEKDGGGSFRLEISVSEDL